MSTSGRFANANLALLAIAGLMATVMSKTDIDAQYPVFVDKDAAAPSAVRKV